MNKPMPIAFETAEVTYYITQQVGRLKHLTARPRDKNSMNGLDQHLFNKPRGVAQKRKPVGWNAA